MKNCPKCEIALEVKNIESVEVDYCSKCEGVWFEKDELRQAKDLTDSDLNWMDFELWKNKDKFMISASTIQCPACKAKMEKLNYDNTGVEIDYCQACEGVWLDKEEFEKIIEALTKELNTKTFSKYIEASIQEAKEIITGPESIISEWKDFSTVLRMMQYRLLVENSDLQDTIIKIQQINPFK